MGIVIGVDVGKQNDPTAVCAAELANRPLDGRDEVHFKVRHLERLPLGTAYPQVAARVAEIVAAVEERAGVTPTLYVDATGVGRPVVDLLEAEGLQVIACTFTRGEERTRKSPGEVTLGKAYLVSRLQALLDAHRLHLPQSPEAAALVDELLDFEIRVDRNGRDRYGAFRVGTHDDLVTALGLAVQHDHEGSL